MKKWLMIVCVLFSLFICDTTFAAPSPLFNVATTGASGFANVSLCLDGYHPFSCQVFNVSKLNLRITTTLPNHTYASAGIRVNTPGVTIANLGIACKVLDDGYCVFSVSNTQAANIMLFGTIVFSPTTLPTATLNTPYSQPITATGGAAPYTYTVTAGSLPPGLALNSSTGVLSGTPTTDNIYNFTVTAVDSVANKNTMAYTLTVSGPLVISPTTLPTATLNSSYHQTLTGSGGVGPYTYAVTLGALPVGLSLNTSTGVISGTPTIDNTYYFTVTTTDSLAHTGSQAFVLQVTGALTISPASLPAASLNTVYSQLLTTSGGVAPFTYAVTTGVLPSGITLNAATGVIYGTPSIDNSTNFTVTSTDVHNYTGTISYSLVVTGPLVISPPSLPSAALNTAYSQTFMASGGTAPYTYSIVTGALPTGLSLNSSTGVLSGTPTVDNSYNFTVKATDAHAFTGSQAYTLVVSGPLTITPTTLPAASLNTLYSQTLTTSGGVGPYTYSAAGALPPGLSLNGSLGRISGTPTTDDTYNFSVTALDANSARGTIAYSIVVSGPLVVAPATLFSATNNIPYNQSISASGGVPPYTYAVISGALPSGLSLNTSTGAISGTPTTVGTFSFTVKATDAHAVTGSTAYSLPVYIQLDSCAFSTTTTTLTCNGVNFLTLDSSGGSAIYRQYSGTSCPFAGQIFNVPGTTSFTNTTYTANGLVPDVGTCSINLCNNSTCTTGITSTVAITSGP